MKFDLQKDTLENGFVWVGDMHVKKGNVEESERIVRWADEQAKTTGVPLVFSGDQYNDFGIARVEAVRFWSRIFEEVSSKTIALLGNHDANSDVSMNFMDIHRDQILVVDRPMMNGQIGLLPFYRKNDLFVSEMNKLAERGAKYLFCHQEFNGCQYENGFYSPNGVDPELIPKSVDRVLGGHIHKEQRFGKVWYPGTPRHLTRSDIGEEKGIWYVNFSTGKEIKIDTPPEVSLPFVEVNITPDFDGDLSAFNSPRTYVNVIGPSDFVKATIKKIPEGVKVRTMPESEVVETSIKESEGIPMAFFNFSMEYANKNGLGNNEIKVIMEKIYDKCPKLKGNA